MRFDTTYFALTIDQRSLDHFEWEEIGADDPRDRLLTAVIMGGAPHHLEAIAVKEIQRGARRRHRGQAAASDLYQENLELYQAADGVSGEPFCTVEIRGRQYCLFMTPYRQ